MSAPQRDVTIESALPVVSANGLNTNQNINFNGGSNTCDLPSSTTINGVAVAGIGNITSSATTGNMFTITNSGVYTGTGVMTITANSATTGDILVISGTAQTTGKGVKIISTSSSAFYVGSATTNPVLQIDASTASQIAGVKITGAATGGTAAIAAIDSGSAANISLNGKGAGTVLIGNSSTGQISIGRGAVAAPIFSSTITSLGTTQNSTPTAAQLLGGVITQTGAVGAGTVTLPTGTQLSTAVTGVAVGDTFECLFANLGGAQTLTITGATGSTVLGTAAVGSGKNARLTFVNTGSNAWNVYVTVSA